MNEKLNYRNFPNRGAIWLSGINTIYEWAPTNQARQQSRCERICQMAVYIVMEVQVINQKKYNQYMSEFSNIITNYGGRCLADEGNIKHLDQEIRLERRQPERMVLLEFPCEVSLRKCLASPEYRSLSELRLAGASTRTRMIQGYKPKKV